MAEAKLFMNGRSQAVRLPKQFRFEGDRVRIRKVGRVVMLEPIATDWDWLDSLQPLDPDALAAALEEVPEQPERPGMKQLFG